jgi:hypothetical protein
VPRSPILDGNRAENAASGGPPAAEGGLARAMLPFRA